LLTAAFMQGIDGGYQWRFRGFHFAVVAGFSGGYGYDVANGLVSPFADESTGSSRPEGMVGALNGNLLRVGAAF
jgi:hypothetical protein